MIRLSEKALVAIGLEKAEDGETVVGTFHRLLVYNVEGFTCDEPSIGPFTEEIDGSTISACVAGSVFVPFNVAKRPEKFAEVTMTDIANVQPEPIRRWSAMRI